MSKVKPCRLISDKLYEVLSFIISKYLIFDILLTFLQVVLIQHVMAHLVTSRTTLRDLKEKLSSVNQLSSNEVAAFLSDSRLSRVSLKKMRQSVPSHQNFHYAFFNFSLFVRNWKNSLYPWHFLLWNNFEISVEYIIFVDRDFTSWS